MGLESASCFTWDGSSMILAKTTVPRWMRNLPNKYSRLPMLSSRKVRERQRSISKPRRKRNQGGIRRMLKQGKRRISELSIYDCLHNKKISNHKAECFIQSSMNGLSTLFLTLFLLLQLQTSMAEANSQETNAFCVEKAYEKGPLHLLHSFRLAQLQNKINFFQGQVDPLLDENISLKDQLVHLTKLVISSTEILRHLLPSSDNPTKKLKLQMATIEEIATMIKEDWHRMEAKLDENARRIQKLKGQKQAWKEKYELQKNQHERETRELQDILQEKNSIFSARIASLQEQLNDLATLHQSQKKQMRDEFANKIKGYQAAQREFQLFKRDSKDREQEYQKSISRLRSEIEANMVSFEQAKKNIKMIYEKLMGEKLAEQAQNFQLLLKMKQDDKMSLLMAMTEAEEDYKRRAAQKEYEITKLTERNDRYREEVGVLKNDIWKRQLQLDKEFEEAKAREEVINSLKANKEKLEKRLKEMKLQNDEEQQNLKRIIKSKEAEIGLLMQEGSASLQKLLAEKQQIQSRYAQQEKQLKQASANLKKNNSVWQKRLEKLKEQWKIQEETLKKQILDEQRAGKSLSERLQQSLDEKSAIINEHNERIRRIEDIHKEQTYILQCKHQAKLSELVEAQQDAIIQLKKMHEREISDLNINANQELREAIASFTERMGQQQQNFLAERNNYDKQLKVIEEEAKSMEKRLAEARQVIQDQQIQHRQALKQFTEATSHQKEKWAQQMNKQLRQFQSQMEKQEAKLISLQEQMQKQIKLLKQANAIQTIQDKFLTEISKLKEEFAEKIKRVEMQRRKQVQALNDAHQHHIEEVKEGFNKDLIIIAQKIQQKSTFLNQRLINGFTDEQLSGLTEYEKKQFIIKKVQQIKNSNAVKEKKIVELQYALDEAERNVEKRVKARKQQLQRQKNLLAKQCNRKVETITSQCNAKVAQIEKERIQHAQVMYEEFQTLKDQHRKEMNAINKRYNELETLFEQRPSRMEDLTKIKELQNMQTKMDIQIQGYQKKMETANEIVKYLNLQLENYKDTYDIFGPNGENTLGGLVGVSAIKTKQSGSPNPQADTQHILDVIKSHRHGSEAKLFSQDRREKEPVAYRKWNDTASPAIKDLKIFQDDQSEHSGMISRDFSQPKQSKEKEKKYSYLLVDKNGSRRNRFKTQRAQNVEHQSEIMMNAENFIKLIKANNEDLPPVVKQMAEQRRKSYRKRKLHKRQPTVGYDQYF